MSCLSAIPFILTPSSTSRFGLLIPSPTTASARTVIIVVAVSSATTAAATTAESAAALAHLATRLGRGLIGPIH
jgi:hypothetical protein